MKTREKFPKRGEVWWVSFDSSIAGEIKKTRPAIIISNDIANKHLNRVQVIPLTTKADQLYPSEAFILVDKKKAKAKADQIATISKQRLQNKISNLNPTELNEVERAIKIQLGL